MISTIIALIIMFFIGRAVLKWARNLTQERNEGIQEIIEYLKEDKDDDDDEDEDEYDD